MNLKEALNPLLMLEGLVTLAVLTDDGLPVEVIGYDNSDAFAAELATVANVARRGFASLELGSANRVCVSVEDLEAIVVPLEAHVFVAVFEQKDSAAAMQLIDKTKAQLQRALGATYEFS